MNHNTYSCTYTIYSCSFNTITATDKNFNVGSNNASSFHRSSSLPAFNSAVNNGPLGSKGLRGDGGFKSNALGTTTNDSFVSGMGQLSISTNKVPMKHSVTNWFSINKKYHSSWFVYDRASLSLNDKMIKSFCLAIVSLFLITMFWVL